LIKILDLGDNKLQDVGVVSLVNAFKQTHHLDTLNFDHNHITDDGADALVEIIISNNKLRALSLHNNYLKAATAAKLAKAINYHYSIEVLLMISIYLSSTDEAEIKQIIRLSTGFVYFHTCFVKPSCLGKGPAIPKRFINYVSRPYPLPDNENDKVLCVSPNADLASIDFWFLKSSHFLRLNKDKTAKLQISVLGDAKGTVFVSWSKPSQIKNLQTFTLFSNISRISVDFNNDT